MQRISRLIILLWLGTIYDAGGQYSRLAYFLDIPQNRFLNPAIRPSDSLYIGLPIISGAGFSIDNNFLRYHDVINKKNDSVSTVNDQGFNTTNLLAHTRKKNLLETDVFIQIAGVAFKAWDGYLFIDINDRMGLDADVPGDLIRLSVIDPDAYKGERFNLSEANAGIYYFREAGIGYSWNQTSGLRAGFKIKLLAGMGSVYSELRNWEVGISETAYSTSADVDVNVSAPLKVNYKNNGMIDEVDLKREESINTILLKRGIKPGLALDIGTTWVATDRISLSASITDLGFIRWGKDNTTFRINEDFDFRGFNVTDPNGDNSINAIGDRFLDSIQRLVKINILHYPFSRVIPASVYTGAEYSLSKNVSLGLLSRTRFITGNIKQSVTLTATLNSQNVSATIGYTAANRTYNNLGAGFALRVGPFQLYLISDRIPFLWDRIDTGNRDIIFPEQWNTFDLRAGLNLLFNKTKKGSDCIFPYRNEIKTGRNKQRS